MRFVGRRLALAALLALSVVTFGLQSAVQAQETDDPVKIEIYKRFYDNAKTNPAAAYPAARDYLSKYSKDKDQYVDYIQKWIAVYERDGRIVAHLVVRIGDVGPVASPFGVYYDEAPLRDEEVLGRLEGLVLRRWPLPVPRAFARVIAGTLHRTSCGLRRLGARIRS